MADRQLSSGREADPRNPLRPAAPAITGSLPKLAGGPFAGYPRVFGVAWAFVAHTDSRFDPDMLLRYVRAYQEVQPLTIGELWAVAITLRIVLIENLRRLAEQIVHSRAARQAGGRSRRPAAGRRRDARRTGAESCSPITRRRALPDAFAVQLVHRLRDQDPRITPALTWLDERLAAQGHDCRRRRARRAPAAGRRATSRCATSSPACA